MQNVEATYRNGVLVPDRPLALEEDSRVRLTFEAETPVPPAQKRDLARAREVLRRIHAAYEPHEMDIDAAANHDRYLYGDKSEFVRQLGPHIAESGADSRDLR